MCRLIAISIVGNEEKKYLTSWLDNVQSYADLHIILTDGATDRTPDIIEEKIQRENASIILKKNNFSQFKINEVTLRSELWELTRLHARKGDWILIVDADEFYDEQLKLRKSMLFHLSKRYRKVTIQILDLWNNNEYRIDGHWSPILYNRIFRFQEEAFNIDTTGLHQTPAPHYVTNAKRSHTYFAKIPCLHKSYATCEAKKQKYQFYTTNAPNSFSLEHASSILGKPPILKKYTLKNRKQIIKNIQKEALLNIFLRIPMIKQKILGKFLEKK